MTPSHPAFDYERDDAARRIRVRPRRALDVYEYIAVLDRQAQEGTWSYGVLWDLRRGAQMLAQTDGDLLASHVYSHLIRCGSRGPVAVVADEHAVVSSTKAYASKAERAGMQVAVFPTVPAAEQWLSQKALPWADAEPAVQPPASLTIQEWRLEIEAAIADGRWRSAAEGVSVEPAAGFFAARHVDTGEHRRVDVPLNTFGTAAARRSEILRRLWPATLSHEPPIILVEDDRNDAFFVRQAVDDAMIRNPVVEFTTADAARASIVAAAPDVALFILDVTLRGGETGFDLLRWIRLQPEPLGSAPAIILSGADREHHDAESRALGTLAFLQKPVAAQPLIDAIHTLGLSVATNLVTGTFTFRIIPRSRD
jgi:CheY-like chemotaxis protein